MISISNEKGLLQRISIGPHTLHSDVSVELGGEGSAPEPHDLFDAADLGALSLERREQLDIVA